MGIAPVKITPELRQPAMRLSAEDISASKLPAMLKTLTPVYWMR